MGDRLNMAYAGTAATYGRGRGVVVATGMETEFGKIAQMLQTVEICKTPLQIDLDRLGRTLAKAAFVVVAAIVALGLWRGQPFVEMLIFGIALAVAVVPEALPAVVTISLAIGVQRMVKRHALMRRLPAVETLGSTSVICSDKTGTLTKDEMTVRQIAVADALVEVSGSGYDPSGQFFCQGAHRTIRTADTAVAGGDAEPPTRICSAKNPTAAGKCMETRPRARWWWQRPKSDWSSPTWRPSFRAWTKFLSVRKPNA